MRDLRAVLRGAATVAGLAAVAFGFLGVVAGVTGPFSLTEAFVLLVGVLALVQGLRYLLDRRETTVRVADLGTPERRSRAPVPGDDFDERTAARQLPEGTLRRVRKRLREAAVTSLVAQGVPESVARERVDSGAWTDDDLAVAFLETGPTPVPLADRVRAFFDRETLTSVRIRRTVAAVDALWDDATTGDSPTEDGDA